MRARARGGCRDRGLRGVAWRLRHVETSRRTARGTSSKPSVRTGVQSLGGSRLSRLFFTPPRLASPRFTPRHATRLFRRSCRPHRATHRPTAVPAARPDRPDSASAASAVSDAHILRLRSRATEKYAPPVARPSRYATILKKSQVRTTRPAAHPPPTTEWPRRSGHRQPPASRSRELRNARAEAFGPYYRRLSLVYRISQSAGYTYVYLHFVPRPYTYACFRRGRSHSLDCRGFYWAKISHYRFFRPRINEPDKIFTYITSTYEYLSKIARSTVRSIFDVGSTR